MSKEKLYQLYKIKPIQNYTQTQVVFIITSTNNPTYLGATLGKYVKEYKNNKLIFQNGVYLINVELCG